MLGFNIFWVSKCEYPAKHVIKPHRHDEYYHLIFVLNGAGNIVVNDSTYRAKINQLYIVKPMVKHGIYASSNKPLNTVEFKFSFSNDYTENVLKLLPEYYENTSIAIRNAFISIVDEIRKQDNYFEEVLVLHLMQVVYYLSRDLGSEAMSLENIDERDTCGSGLEKYKSLKNVTMYIKENYWKDISLSDMAAMVHLSPVYFCSVFKESYGISPMNYLQNVRVENAKKLLANSEKSVTDIAFEVGFQSGHYFSRYFKNHEGISPNDFRRRNKGYIYKDFVGSITDFSKSEG